LLLAALSACKSVPKTADTLFSERLPLDSGASVYLFADVTETQWLLSQIPLVSAADTAQVLERTRYAVAAFYPPEAGKKFQAVAWGKYPSFKAGFGFTFDKAWKKQKSPTGRSFWFSADQGLSLALSGSQAFVAQAADAAQTVNAAQAADPFAREPGVDIPPGFAEFREQASLALWMDNPSVPLTRIFEGLGLPIQIPADELMLSLLTLSPASDAPASATAGPGESGALYEIKIRLKTPAAINARSLVALFSTARLFLPRPARGSGEAGGGLIELLSLLLARTPEQDGVYLNLRTAPLNARDITLLMSLFSVYSTQN
jgi:hypothetical protein